MPQDIDISVIIPVYNAKAFLTRAVDSALAQNEVREIIIVDDASSDGSLPLAEKLVSANNGRIRLLRHADGGNHGAGASRNLGIEKASCDWIAFLDADDYYLPGRFSKDIDVLSKDPSLDGVYDALGLDLANDTENWWKKAGNYSGLVTLRKRLSPEDLFAHMAPVGIDGSFSTDTILVHKRIFKKTGCAFGTSKFGEDTLLWMQMAAVGRLASASIDKPVAMRGVHGGNSIRGNTDHRKTLSSVFSSFRAWQKFGELSAKDSRAFEMAGIHLASDWREMSRAFRASRGLFSVAAWRQFLRWFFVRQFPEDPVLPGIMPKQRRRIQN